MIAAVPSPMERLAGRLRGRFERWIDGLCVDPPVMPPEPARGLPRVLRELERGNVVGSQREIAKTLGTSRATVQRAQRFRKLENIP